VVGMVLEPVGIPAFVFEFWNLVAGYPKLELREIPTPQDHATSPRFPC
jgi:hypothetical protein